MASREIALTSFNVCLFLLEVTAFGVRCIWVQISAAHDTVLTASGGGYLTQCVELQEVSPYCPTDHMRK